MPSMRFILVGGFLGAGKTTTVGRLAGLYQQQGLKVGIVTNDQAADLVDTQTLRSQGYQVGEVAGACFCCHFNEMTDTVAALSATERPDVILAEPVGSCTDLVATVIQPLRQIYGEQFSVAPYGVIVKPSHARRILDPAAAANRRGGFSPKAEYIFRKQLEEADFLLMNRVDELTPEDVEQFVTQLNDVAPGVPVIRVSAREGTGFEAVLEFLNQDGQFGQRILDIDYDIYAEGEVELGWLNASLTLTAEQPYPLDAVIYQLVESLRTELNAAEAETAHLKVIGLSQESYAVANLVSSDSPAELSLASQAQVREANLVINARVAADPELLERLVRESVSQVAAQHHGQTTFQQMHTLRPGRPVPVHRFNTAG